MPDYKAPVRDISFVINEVLESEKLYQTLPGYEDATEDLLNAIVEEGAKFAENELAPLNQVGDEQGCTWSEEGVKTPEGFAEAYRQYVDNGWPALAASPQDGGQGMPNMLAMCITEMVGSANWSWGMYPGLSHGAVNTHGIPLWNRSRPASYQGRTPG
jgi:alkylation response protein AidB-like acyl-CoA dehydrogenase